MDQYQHILTQLLEQLEIGNYGRVARRAEELAQSNDPDWQKQGLYYGVVALMNQGAIEQSREKLAQLLELFPDFMEAHKLQVQLHIAQRDFTAAEAAAKKLYEAFPNEMDALTTYLYVLELLGHYDQIIPHCEAFLAQHPDNWEIQLALGDANFRQGNHAAALEQYKAVQDYMQAHDAGISPDDFLESIGECLVLTEDYAAALPLLQRAQELEPGSPRVLPTLGYATHALGDSPAGLAYLNDSLRQNADNLRGLYYRGRLHLDREDYDAAYDDLSRARALDYALFHGPAVDELIEEYFEEED